MSHNDVEDASSPKARDPDTTESIAIEVENDAKHDGIDTKISNQEVVNDQAAFEVVGHVLPAELVWHDVALTVRNKAARGGGCGRKQSTESVPPTVTILRECNGCVQPGDLVAIMGASGAGKTSLLNVLSRRNTLNKGTVELNGEPVSGTFSRIAAFVQQEDLFLGSLTVREHLLYQARLRLGDAVQAEERARRVDALIDALRLRKCAHNVVGSIATGRSRGISGGERKRLSFASEILTNPSILFADEPTSGLDAHMAENVVKMMSDVAKAGRTVLATIHQPSSDVYNMFDKLILLRDGRIVYFGDREAAVHYFAQFGDDFKCPEYTNPADFFIKMLAVHDKNAKTYDTVSTFADVWAKSEYNTNGMPHDLENGKERTRTVSVENSGVNTAITPALGKYACTWWTQFSVLLSRAMRNTSRDPILTYARAMQTLVLALLAGFIFFQLDTNQRGIQNKNGAIFFVLINQSFGGIFGVLQTFPMERPILMREHESGNYSLSSYYLSKLIADLPFQVVFPFLFCTITFWMMGLGVEFWRYIAFTGIIVLTSNVAISLGYFISSAVPNIGVALALGPVILLPLMLTGGLFVNAASIPKGLIWLESISPFKYAYNIAGNVIWKDINIPCSADTQACYPDGNAVMDEYFPDAKPWLDLMVLFIMVVALRTLTFIALKLNVRQKQNEQ